MTKINGTIIDAEEKAGAMALSMLGWLVETPDALAQFCTETGFVPEALARDISRDTLTQNTWQTDMLTGVVDFLLTHEDWLLQYCDAKGVPPQLPAMMRSHLPGGEQADDIAD